VDSVGIGARLSIQVATPTMVRVRYRARAAPADTLELVASLIAGGGPVVLTRLAHGVSYDFSVVPLDPAGLPGPATTGSFVTPPLPPDLATLQVAVTGAPTNDLTMLSPRTDGGFNGVVAVDATGAVVWYYRTVGPSQGVVRRANGDFVINDLGNGLREITPNGDVLYALPFDALGATPHHDLIETPNGHILFISQDFRTPPGSPTIWGEAIYEWVPETGELTKRWTAWDWYDPSSDWGRRSTVLDWLHANSLAIGPHGNIVLSLNWINQIISIAPDWSHLEWRLGGPRSDFVLDSAAIFSGQHAATMPTEGRVLMFDNQRESTAGSPASRGLELALDLATHRARVAWEFRPPARTFAPYLGFARRLANGDTFLSFGLPPGRFNDLYATGPISAFEVTPTNAIRFQATVTGARTVYRAWPAPQIGSETVIH
jgi:hypothetical protein